MKRKITFHNFLYYLAILFITCSNSYSTDTPELDTYLGTHSYGKIFLKDDKIVDLDAIHDHLKESEQIITNYINPLFKDKEKNTNNIVLGQIGIIFEALQDNSIACEHKLYNIIDDNIADQELDNQEQPIRIFESRCKDDDLPKDLVVSNLKDTYFKEKISKFYLDQIKTLIIEYGKKFPLINRKIDEYVEQFKNILINNKIDYSGNKEIDGIFDKLLIEFNNHLNNFNKLNSSMFLKNQLEDISFLYSNFQETWIKNTQVSDLPSSKAIQGEFFDKYKNIKMTSGDLQSLLLQETQNALKYISSLNDTINLTNKLCLSALVSKNQYDSDFETVNSLNQHISCKERPSESLEHLYEHKKLIKSKEDDLRNSIYTLYGAFWHSEQRLIKALSDENKTLWEQIREEIIAGKTIKKVYFHIHSRYNFCLRCRYSLIRFAHSHLKDIFSTNVLKQSTSELDFPLYILGSFSEKYEASVVDSSGNKLNMFPFKIYNDSSSNFSSVIEKFKDRPIMYIKSYVQDINSSKNEAKMSDNFKDEIKATDQAEETLGTEEESNTLFNDLYEE